MSQILRLKFTISLFLATTFSLLWYINHTAKNADQNNLNEIYFNNYDKVFLVEDVVDYRKHGTGFLVQGQSGKKYIMTNAHVCESKGNMANIRNQFANFRANVLFQNPKADICLLGTPKELNIKPITIAQQDIFTNEKVYSLGYPAALQLVFSEGLVSYTDSLGMEELFENQNYCTYLKLSQSGLEVICVVKRNIWVSTMHIIPGQSGSPVFNSNGEVVGVIFINLMGGMYSGFILLEEIQEVLRNF